MIWKANAAKDHVHIDDDLHPPLVEQNYHFPHIILTGMGVQATCEKPWGSSKPEGEMELGHLSDLRQVRCVAPERVSTYFCSLSILHNNGRQSHRAAALPLRFTLMCVATTWPVKPMLHVVSSVP